LKELSPAAAAACLRANPRLLVPAGTLQLRGPHLPLGCDTIILERLADDVSARTGIARTPAVEFGVNAPDDPVGPGIASLTRKTLHRVMNELIAAWETVAEVRHTYILTAHAADAHQEALSTIRATGVVSLVDIFSVDLRPQLERPDGPIHGGEIDTSILLHLAPELVAQGRMPPGLAATDLKGARFFNAILEAVVRHVGAR